MNLRRPAIRHAILSIAFLVTHLLLARPEVVIISRLGYVAWYPAVGLAIAILLGVSPWYALLFCFADGLAGILNYGQPFRSYSGTVGVVGVGLCYGIAAYILRGPLKIDSELRRRSDVVKYVFINISGAAGATIFGTLCLVGDHSIGWNEFYTSGLQWFLGDMIAVLGIAPFLLIFVLPRVRQWLLSQPDNSSSERESSRRARIDFRQAVETLGQAATLVGVVWLIFARNAGNFSLFYMGFIPIIWIAMRRGIRGTVIGVLALNSGVAIAMRFFPPTVDLFGKTAVFMMVVSATGLLVGSGLSERDRLALDLNEQTTYLMALIQSSPFGIVVLDRQGQVEVVNPAFQKILVNAEEEIDAINLACILPRTSSPANASDLIREVLEGRRLQKTIRRQRSDGTFLDLAVHAVPLTIGKAVRGAYMIYQDISEQVRASETERNYSESLSKLVTELQLRAHEMTLLNEMKDLFECCATPVEASKVVAESVQKLLPQTSSGSLYMFQSSSDLAETAVNWGQSGTSEEFLTRDSCWCLRRGQPHWSEHSGNGLSCSHLLSSPTGTSLCVPVMAHGRTLGVLHLEFPIVEIVPHSNTHKHWRTSLQLLATSVAGQAAMTFAGLTLQQKLKEQSIRDPLTELFNRRFMDEALEREMVRAARNSRPLSVALIDIDHFKQFNDTFGHDAGDRVLQSIADLLRTFFRACDICCRHGGEEFAVILPDASLQNAVVRVNALRTEVKRLNLMYDNQSLGPITISVGVAAFPEHGSTYEALLKTADRCLYESKAGGRDVVTAAPPQIVSLPG
jgi:diguanylate cyclase (GGDEF)-like protein/PAS domain S-box-containing protein